MKKNSKTLEDRMMIRIKRSNAVVFMRQDFSDLGGYSQVGRVLRVLITKGLLINIGYGLYARARKSTITGKIIPEKSLPDLAKEALKRMGIETTPSSADQAYHSGKSHQVPTGRVIGVRGRISRKIKYNGASISFEKMT